MFYQKPKGFRSSFRGGASQNNNRFRRPFRNNGRFSQQRNAHQSKLIGQDINIFIKKAGDVLSKEKFTPHNSFSDFDLSTPLRQNIINSGFTQPTPIQDKAIQPILEGKDLIGLASTGTGKTAAFLIPLIDTVFKNRDKKAIIIAPTRELALQINEELRNFSSYMHIYSALVIGGKNMGRQIFDIRRNPHFVIGTPGRLKDLIGQRVLNLNDFNIFVLDEVDLMVDIGFLSYVEYFVSLLPQNRQSLFFSATISPKIQTVLQKFVRNPITISVKNQETSENVDQDVVRVINGKKIDQLHDLLIKDGFDKVLVFGKTKHGVEKLNKDLEFRGFRVGSIHGNKRQSQRQRVLDSFKRNDIQVLLATDVAARGLDIDNVTHVINYDLPQTYEDYIHRIGRTGRAGKTGVALTFVD